MSAPALPTRLPGAAGPPKQPEDVYRIAVRWPAGDLAYRATRDQEAELRTAGLVDEVRSPTGVLRYLRLHRHWNLLLPSQTCIITRHVTEGLKWKQQAARAKSGNVGSRLPLRLIFDRRSENAEKQVECEINSELAEHLGSSGIPSRSYLQKLKHLGLAQGKSTD